MIALGGFPTETGCPFFLSAFWSGLKFMVGGLLALVSCLVFEVSPALRACLDHTCFPLALVGCAGFLCGFLVGFAVFPGLFRRRVSSGPYSAFFLFFSLGVGIGLLLVGF